MPRARWPRLGPLGSQATMFSLNPQWLLVKEAADTLNYTRENRKSRREDQGQEEDGER